jgi:hypothetical protein
MTIETQGGKNMRLLKPEERFRGEGRPAALEHLSETREQLETRARSIVEMAGASWHGLQYIQGEDIPLEHLALFGWARNASTLALPISQVTVDNVRAKLEGTYSAKNEVLAR